jgi:hypothetical protein
MTIITTTLHVTADGAILTAEKLPEGDYTATIIPAGPKRSRRSVREMLVYHGPWDDSISLRREDLYGDDGR